jgi:hypothetical protein
MLAHTCFEALGPIDGGTSTVADQLVRLREQVAVVRAIADHVDAFARPGDVDELGDQVIEEAARLGCRLLETAATMIRTSSRVAPRGRSTLADW